MIRTSEQTAELMKSLATAQGKFSAATKNSQNPAFRSKYADLSAVIEATLEHLNAAGVVVMQHPALDYKGEGDNREAFVTVTTRLQLGGEWIESDVAIPAVMRDRFDAQSVGSAITYGCRYALQSILVVPREDDDGNQATGRGTSEAQAVGQKKIEDLKRKATNGGKPVQQAPNTLFYVEPEAHKGFFAEFINLKEFGHGLDEVAAEGLRQVLKPFISRVTKEETVLVSTSKMNVLLEKLAGDCGITVKKLESPANA